MVWIWNIRITTWLILDLFQVSISFLYPLKTENFLFLCIQGVQKGNISLKQVNDFYPQSTIKYTNLFILFCYNLIIGMFFGWRDQLGSDSSFVGFSENNLFDFKNNLHGLANFLICLWQHNTFSFNRKFFFFLNSFIRCHKQLGKYNFLVEADFISRTECINIQVKIGSNSNEMIKCWVNNPGIVANFRLWYETNLSVLFNIYPP